MSKLSVLIDKDLARQFGTQLWQARQEHHLYLKNVATAINVLERLIEGMELGKFMRYGVLVRLLKFYEKKVKLTLEH